MLTDLVLRVMEISLTTSILIGILLLMVPLLQKYYRVQCRYMVWIVLAVRLLLPFKFILPLHPFEIEIPKQDAVATAWYLEEDEISQESIYPEPATDLYEEGDTKAVKSSGLDLSPIKIAGFVWLAGVCIFLLIQIGSYHIYLRKLRFSHKESTPEFITASLQEIGRDMGVSKVPEAFITSVVGAPMLIGVLYPRILIPHAQYSIEEISFILQHEMSHYQRKDMWYKLVLLMANALHWFNPLIYIMSAQAARDIELVCDYTVTNKLNHNERTQYANTILSAMQRRGRENPMFSTRFGSSKQDMKDRLYNIFDITKKRRGITVLCLIVLCTLVSTGMVSFAYASPAKLQDQEVKVVEDLLVNVKAVDNTWLATYSVKGDTWDEQIEAEIKWFDEVYNKNKADFVIKETLPITEATNTTRLEYLYQNSKVFRSMNTMSNGIFRVDSGDALPGFGLIYEDGMMQRTAVMVDNEEPITLDINYDLSKGKIAVWLVNPSGETLYQGSESSRCKVKQTYPGVKGIWSVILVANSKNTAIKGNLTINLLSDNQASQQNTTSATPSEDFSIERLGKHTFAKGDVFEVNLQWNRRGNVMVLYTEDALTDRQLIRALQGIPNIPEYNESDDDEGELGSVLHFSVSTKSPLTWKQKMTDAGTYYVYLIRILKPGKVTGSIVMKRGEKTIETIW